MKKFIIIEHEPLTIRLLRIWNIEELRQRGVDVEYWDVSSLVFLGMAQVIPNKVQDKCVRYISTTNSLESLLKTNDASKTVYSLEIFENWDNRKILLLFRKYHCFCVKIDLYANTEIPSPFCERLKSYLKRVTFKSFFKKISWICYHKTILKNIIETNLSSSAVVHPDIRINHPDFEEFKKADSPIIKGHYIVFIDIYYPLHPEIKYSLKKNIKEYTAAYRKTMTSFFDYISRKYSLEVVIAAHPKADYTGNEFGDIRIIKNHTCNLVKYTDMVITHGSNSLSFIALADKPFIMVFPDSYTHIEDMYSYIISLSKAIKKTAYNLDKVNWDTISFSKMNEKTRQNYIETYLTSKETENKKNCDIWIEKLLT